MNTWLRNYSYTQYKSWLNLAIESKVVSQKVNAHHKPYVKALHRTSTQILLESNLDVYKNTRYTNVQKYKMHFTVLLPNKIKKKHYKTFKKCLHSFWQSKNIDFKKTLDIIYSTNPDYYGNSKISSQQNSIRQNSVGWCLDVIYAVTLPHACCAEFPQWAETLREANQQQKTKQQQRVVLKFGSCLGHKKTHQASICCHTCHSIFFNMRVIWNLFQQIPATGNTTKTLIWLTTFETHSKWSNLCGTTGVPRVTCGEDTRITRQIQLLLTKNREGRDEHHWQQGEMD